MNVFGCMVSISSPSVLPSLSSRALYEPAPAKGFFYLDLTFKIPAAHTKEQHTDTSTHGSKCIIALLHYCMIAQVSLEWLPPFPTVLWSILYLLLRAPSEKLWSVMPWWIKEVFDLLVRHLRRSSLSPNR